jgi:hypothetical protein
MPICAATGRPFTISEQEAALRAALSPIIGGQKILFPEPKLCPEERQRRRLATRNERILYRTTSAVSGKSLISSYSPDKSYQVVSREEWHQLDNTQFGQDFDFQRPVFEQFAELALKTYKPNVIQDGEMVNSDFTQFCGWSKNCYLTFDSGKNEDCSYGALFIYCKDSYDCFYAVESELCYECVKIHNCYQLFYSQFCQNCSFSAFLSDCIGCKNCIGCTNLRNKEYYVFNKPVGKAEFERIWSHYFSNNHSALAELKAKFQELQNSSYKRALRNVSCENSSGDLLTDCSEIHDSFNCSFARNGFHCHDCAGFEHVMDASMFGEGMQHCYEVSGCGGARGKASVSNCYFSTYIFYGGYNIFYSNSCHQNCSELFACTDLRHKSYCILNKQYSKQEYELLVPRIIDHMQRTGEWGEFFPMKLSPYGYNESIAQEFLPLTREQAEKLGANWSDYKSPVPNVLKTLAAELIEDKTLLADGSALETGIRCSNSGKIFRLTRPEINFYSRYGLPLPRLHPKNDRNSEACSLIRGNCGKSTAQKQGQ